MPFSFDDDKHQESDGIYSAERPVVEIVIGEGVVRSPVFNTPITIPPLCDASYKHADGRHHADSPTIPSLQSNDIQPYAGLPLVPPYDNSGLGPEPTLDSPEPLPVMPSLDNVPDEGTLDDEAGSSVFFNDDGHLYRSPSCDETHVIPKTKKRTKTTEEAMSGGGIGPVRAPRHQRVSHQKGTPQIKSLPSARLKNQASGETLDDVIKSGSSALPKEFKKVTASMHSRQRTVVAKIGVLHSACFNQSMQIYISQTTLPSRISTNEFVVHSTNDDLMKLIEPEIESIRVKMYEMSRKKIEFYNDLVAKHLFDNQQDN